MSIVGSILGYSFAGLATRNVVEAAAVSAVDDVGETTINTPVEINVLANDVAGSYAIDTASVVVVLPPFGETEITGVGLITYTPPMNFTGEDIFVYQIFDVQGASSDTAFVTVQVLEDVAVTYANGYAARSRIRVPSEQVSGDTALANFIMLVDITDDDLRTVANGGLVESADGWDIRFESPSNVQLPHRNISYDGVAGRLKAYVRATPNGGSDTTRYLYIGKAGLVATEELPETLYSAYWAVWNCETGVDYTVNGRDLTPVSVTSGSIYGGGGTYDGVGSKLSANLTDWDGADALTVQIFAQMDADSIGSNRGMIQQGEDGVPGSDMGIAIYHRAATGSGSAVNPLFGNVGTTISNGYFVSTANQQTASPMWLSLRWSDGLDPEMWKNRAKLNVNAEQVATGVTQQKPAIAPDKWWIGRSTANPQFPSDGSFKGVLEEARVLRGTSLSDDWLNTEGTNYGDPDLFYGRSAFDLPNTNQSPVAVPFEVTCIGNSFVTVPVIARAFDPDGTALTISNDGTPSHGTTTNSGGVITYTPTTDYSGMDEFTYTVTDGTATASAKVQVTVTAVVTSTEELPTPLRIINIANNTELTSLLAGTFGGFGSVKAGDEIRLASGAYNTIRTFSISGTQTRPIVWKANTVLGVTVNNNGLLKWTCTGADNTFVGILFNGTAINLKGNRNRLLRCKTHHCKVSAIQVSENTTGIDIGYCDISTEPFVFGVTPTDGVDDVRSGIKALLPGSAIGAKNVRIHHCYIHDFSMKPLPGSQNYDIAFNTVIITADSSDAANQSGKWLVEYNLFERCDCSIPNATGTGPGSRVGNIECKNSDNTFQYNTFLDSPGLITSRQGFGNKYISNWIENSGGIALYAGEEGTTRADTALSDRHQVVNNFLRGTAAGIRTMAGTEATWSGKANFQTASHGSWLVGNDSNLYDIGEDFGDNTRFPSLRTKIEACRKGTGATFGSGTLITDANKASMVSMDNDGVPHSTIVSGTTTYTPLPTVNPVKLTLSQVGPTTSWKG